MYCSVIENPAEQHMATFILIYQVTLFKVYPCSIISNCTNNHGIFQETNFYRQNVPAIKALLQSINFHLHTLIILLLHLPSGVDKCMKSMISYDKSVCDIYLCKPVAFGCVEHGEYQAAVWLASPGFSD